jgi:hypothetical protein
VPIYACAAMVVKQIENGQQQQLVQEVIGAGNRDTALAAFRAKVTMRNPGALYASFSVIEVPAAAMQAAVAQERPGLTLPS